MPWRELSVMDQREGFVKLALAPEANKRELCRRFGSVNSIIALGRHAADFFDSIGP